MLSTQRIFQQSCFKFVVTYISSWHLTSTTGPSAGQSSSAGFSLLFREERCFSFTFRVALGHEPYCNCWLETCISTMSTFQENGLVFSMTAAQFSVGIINCRVAEVNHFLNPQRTCNHSTEVKTSKSPAGD